MTTAFEIVRVMLKNLGPIKYGKTVMFLDVNDIDLFEITNVDIKNIANNNIDDSDDEKVWDYPFQEYKDEVFSILDGLGYKAMICEEFDSCGYPFAYLFVEPK